jgi:hypothetical protein
VNDFKTLYQNNPPTVETLATDSRSVNTATAPAGSRGGGGCSLGGAGRFDPLLPGLLFAAMVLLARRRRG